MTPRSPIHPPVLLESGGRFDFAADPPPGSILVILGDVLEETVLALPILEGLHRQWPQAHLWVVTDPGSADLVAGMPGVAGVLPLQRNLPDRAWALTPDLARQLREEVRPDWTLTVPVSRDLLLDAFALASFAPIRVGHLGDARRATPEEQAQTAGYYSHLLLAPEDAGTELDRHHDLLRALGVAEPYALPRLPLTADAEAAAARLLREHGLPERGFIALGLDAADPNRIYPHWGEALRRVAERHPDLPLAILGTERDGDLAARIREALPATAIALCGEHPLPLLAALLSRATLMVGVESGLAQLAGAVGTPQVVVQGGGLFARFLPHRAGTVCVANPLQCFGCAWSCTQLRHHCLLDLQPGVVADALLKALEGAFAPDRPGLVTQAARTGETEPAPLDLGPLLAPGSVTHVALSPEPLEGTVDFTVVVPSMGRPDHLEAMLRSLPAALAGATWELVGIHPGDDRATHEVFLRHGAARILRDEDHPGPDGRFCWSTLMNAGLAGARGRWFMYGSDDLLFEPESIARAMAYGDLSGPRTGGVALLEHNPSRRNCPAWFIPMGYDRRPMINFGVVRREALQRVGGFHDGFHFYCADFDLCSRILAAGWEILPLWDARVRHHQILADHSHTAHESRHDADRALMFARAHLHPTSLWPDGRKEYSDLTEEQARAFAFRILETQIRTGLLRNPEAYGRRLETWAHRLPAFGALKAMVAMAHHLRGESEAADRCFEAAARLGWTGPWKEGGPAHPVAKTARPNPRTTVFCAVWHRDPDRHALLKGHQACLDAQLVPVERIYVFDGGDAPPPWLKGRHIVRPEGLSIYEAWALALEAADTPYVANLNLDDRLNPDAVAIFERVLDDGADLVGGDWQICFSQMETDAVARSQEATALPFDPAWPPRPGKPVRLGSGLGERGTLGPACAWRRDLHRQIRGFPTRFGDGSPVRVIGDALWWRLVSEAGRAVRRLPILLGRYHSHPEGQAEFRTPAEAEEDHYQRHGLG